MRASGGDDRPEEGNAWPTAAEPDPDRSADPRFPLEEQTPTIGPVGQGDITGAPELPDNLANPSRRKHPTILSAEGEQEAPLSELPPGEGV
ncbi:MAG: hypothetical protein GX774_08365 [Armatimonadetes bacterium]|jgi:hypothetical protein|nr:hypothetical protein [Armatimonadota bacterium]